MYTQIEKCCRQIVQSLNMPDPGVWNTEDFEKLSDSLFGKTGVRLSVSTLKRIWGKVNYNSSPSVSTLNTLARFLDYENWRDFQQKNPDESLPEHSISEHPTREQPVSKQSFSAQEDIPGPAARKKMAAKKKMWVPALLGIAIVLLLGWVLSGSFLSGKKQNPDVPAPRSTSPLKFESRTTSDDLPNSVVFDYDASSSGTDSVYIQQSWDPMRREKVPVAGKQHTSLYYYPGYFDAKLIVNGQVEKQSPVFIKTKGWKGIIETRPVPVYLTAEEIKVAGSLGVNSSTLLQKTGSSVFNDTWVNLLNVREFEGIDAGHFIMEAVLKNTSTVEQSLCRKINITIIGKRSAIIIPLAAKGCIADIQLLTGDRMILGKNQDLSGLGCDFSTFQRISCQVENGHLRISLNGILVLDTPQQKTIGDIVGLSVEFQGTGEVRQISLGSAGKTVYEEKF